MTDLQGKVGPISLDGVISNLIAAKGSVDTAVTAFAAALDNIPTGTIADKTVAAIGKKINGIIKRLEGTVATLNKKNATLVARATKAANKDAVVAARAAKAQARATKLEASIKKATERKAKLDALAQGNK